MFVHIECSGDVHCTGLWAVWNTFNTRKLMVKKSKTRFAK